MSAHITLRSNSTKIGQAWRARIRRYPEVVDHVVAEKAREAQGLFEQTTKSWAHAVQFIMIRAGPARYEVGTSDPIYKFVDEGTPPHIITPRRATALRWTGPYHPKTKPNVIASFGGGRGNVEVWARRVQHPGTQARNFSTIIRERVNRSTLTALRQSLRVLNTTEAAGL